MKSDPGNDELVKKVARAIAYELGYTWGSSALGDHDAFYDAAFAVLAVARQAIRREALEECAKVVSQQWCKPWYFYYSEELEGCAKSVCVEAAAAIRAME